MKIANITSAALAVVLTAGTAFAYSPSEDANVPTREYELEVVSTGDTHGERVSVDTDSIYHGSERALISDEKVNQYIFTAQDSSAADSRGAAARYR